MTDNEIKEYCLQEAGIDLGRYSYKELTEIKDALRRYHNTKLKLLSIADVIRCVCHNEIKTGTVSIHCCNLCGKPDEDWWGKH